MVGTAQVSIINQKYLAPHFKAKILVPALQKGRGSDVFELLNSRHYLNLGFPRGFDHALFYPLDVLQ